MEEWTIAKIDPNLTPLIRLVPELMFLVGYTVRSYCNSSMKRVYSNLIRKLTRLFIDKYHQ